MEDASNSQSDYYAVLGVAQNASEEQIKKAFREKALVLHPDQSGRGADAFHKLQASGGRKWANE